MPDALLDEVTALVEWPAVYAGAFDPAFLAVPQECLILTMQQNQKYFALADADGRLAHALPRRQQPRDRRPARDRRGQRARAARAARRCAVLLRPGPQGAARGARADSSRSVVYHNKLGTQLERVERAAQLARRHRRDDRRRPRRTPSARRGSPRPISSPTWSASFPSCRASWAATTPSTTASRAEVADAIEQHYWPRFAGDALPDGAGRAGGRARRQARDARRHVRHRRAADRRQGSVRPAPRTRSA